MSNHKCFPAREVFLSMAVLILGQGERDQYIVTSRHGNKSLVLSQ